MWKLWRAAVASCLFVGQVSISLRNASGLCVVPQCERRRSEIFPLKEVNRLKKPLQRSKRGQPLQRSTVQSQPL